MCKLLSIISLLLLSFCVTAQSNFQIVGNSFGISTINSVACSEVDTCFTLTPDVNTQAGAVWDLNPVDLSKKFDALFCLTLGSNDITGADGFAFVMRTPGSLAIGQTGGGLGYLGIQPSLAVEFDTWDNGLANDDIADDHTGMYGNGDFVNPLVAATTLSPTGANIEDGNYHTTRIVWNPENDSLKMYFDGNLRLAYQGDIRNSIFGGQDFVLWGFTASTGGSTNLQQICFPNRTIYLQDTTICDGDSVAVSYYTDNITKYNWSTLNGETIVDWDASSGTSFDLNDTIFYAYSTNDYILNIEFNNMFYTDTMTITVVPLPISPFNETQIEYCPDTTSLTLDAQNAGDSYLWWPTGSTGQFQPIIGEIEYQGWYSVEITEPINQCKTSDSILISMYCLPDLEVPNVFTPNGDGQNDYFEVILKTGPDWVANLEFEVFNRWGNEVYSSTVLPKWDGSSTTNQSELNDGVYFYKISYTDTRNLQQFEFHGNITLIR